MIRILALLAALVALAPTQANAQASVIPYCLTTQTGPNQFQPCSSTWPLAVSASVSASVTGFTPSAAGARGTPLSVTTSDSSGNLPTGAVVAVTNVGANPMYCNVNGIAATTSDQYISSSGGWFAFTIPAAITTLHCIATGSSTTANTVGGSGIATGTGGGGGGGGGGGAITIDSGAVSSGAYASGSIASGALASGAISSGADVTEGTTAETTVYAGSGGCTVVACLKGLYAGVTGAIPAGSNLIGSVGIDQTTPGTTNKVVASVSSGGIASGAIASGAVASGAVASGAFASGALASGSIAAGAQVDLLTMRGTVAAGTAAANSMLTGAVFNSTAPTLTTGQQAAVQVSSRGGLLLGNGYPAGSTPITISGTGTTGATTATLATGASVTTYICGFSIRANANAAVTGNATVTGTITGTLNFTQWTAPNASGLGVTEEVFSPCIPASAVNTGIAVISAAPSTGGVVSVTAWGYTL